MPLIESNQLSKRFRELASDADRIDIAVAWARPCEAIEALAASRANIRIAVGTSKNFTDPTTLKRLNEIAELRIVSDRSLRIFHPKYYYFQGTNTICWVGSANLTGGGFGGNIELVHEFKIKSDEHRDWFESIWGGLESDPTPAIVAYEKNYSAPQRSPRPSNSIGEPQLPSLADIETWSDFVEGLRTYDEYYRYRDEKWDVLGETHSWLHTIKTGREVIRLRNWTKLTKRECYILRGFKAQNDQEGDWRLLGTLPFGGAPYVFNNNNRPRVDQMRTKIKEQLDKVLRTDLSKNAEDACNAMEAIRNLRHVEDTYHRIGHAAATRWLTLARPDYLVSVNTASAWRLGEASGYPRTSNNLADVYSDFLSWLHGRGWFKELNGHQPENPQEREMWNCRAALVDVFAFDPRRDP